MNKKGEEKLVVTEKSKNKLQVRQIAKINLRHNFLPLFLLSLIILAITPILFGTANLNETASAVPLEMLVSIIGVVILTPLFHPEQNTEIEDIISSKYVNNTYVHLIRVIYSIIGIAVLIICFSVYMLICRCKLTIPLILGTFADAMFLGSIGLLSAAVSNNLPVAFMVSILYYLLNITIQSKLGYFNLFSMMNGNYTPNLWLLTSSILIIVLAILIKRIITKCR